MRLQAISTKLRTNVSEKVLDLLISGKLPPGKINESQLAARMRVSRTPLREALVALDSAGLVVTLDRGFAVPPLKNIEAREVYQIIARLETLALEAAGIPDRSALAELRRLNGHFRFFGKDGLAALDVDTRFHEALIARCPNLRLQSLISRQKLLVRRYELLYFHDPRFFARSARQHESIVECLSADDLTGACEALDRNWNSALEHLTWLVRD
jgi:DNA-binding GntR family transcriptional regulator